MSAFFLRVLEGFPSFENLSEALFPRDAFLVWVTFLKEHRR